MSTPQIRQVIARLADGHTLTEDEIHGVLDAMTDGAASPVQMGALLMALRVRGETVEEITGAAQGLRARMLRISAPRGAIDIVFTETGLKITLEGREIHFGTPEGGIARQFLPQAEAADARELDQVASVTGFRELRDAPRATDGVERGQPQILPA